MKKENEFKKDYVKEESEFIKKMIVFKSPIAICKLWIF